MSERLFDIQPFQTGLDVPVGQLDSTTLGLIAERIVEARCLERGLLVARPSADVNGVDLVVAGLRVQVRSTATPRVLQKSRPRYCFEVRARSVRGVRRPHAATRCDVFAFYAHDRALLWLLPSEVVRERFPSRWARFYPDDQAGLDDFTIFEGRW